MNNIENLKEQYKIDLDEFRFIESEIIKQFTKFVDSSANPKAIILGAQPGAGKTELEKIAFSNLKRNAVICNVDNLKNYHPFSVEIKKKYPEYFSELTSTTAHDWNLSLRRHCLEKNYNFILETTFNDGININTIIENLKKNNFSVEIYLLSVPQLLSKLGIVQRYEEMLNLNISGRKVSFESHDDRYDAIPKAIQIVEEKQLYDYINLFGRSILNHNKIDDKGIYLIAKTKKSIYDDFIIEREQKLNNQARIEINSIKNKILELMDGRNAPEDEISIFKDTFEIEIDLKNKSKILKK
ncbi:zeta toxin family protein [Chryseobacterium oncorhynchi]|uniref:Zeta toxin domain-containing protein n=1 Tax=Chryseobacterium oncorhynchi TaxID=741074 RepID=A0A316WFR7_9FLAO|nr:zeta toxin family protein [Chryseobacterium oncorhynchi]PWN59959.1 hypothetical protein C1638_020545 [Chryseobacterium oncorhynchi]